MGKCMTPSRGGVSAGKEWNSMVILFSCIITAVSPRSSMDRVTDFESGGCAFDPRRGRFKHSMLFYHIVSVEDRL
jgi:hypothetical protein